MAKINTLNYQTVAAWNGSQDLFVVEQPDGTKVATPAMVKQFMEAGDFEATGEVKDGHGNVLNDLAVQASELNDKIGAIKDLTTSTISFANAGSIAGIQYGSDHADIIHSNIANLSTGIFNMDTYGPKIGVVLFKYSDVYYAGIILYYFAMNERKPLYFVYQSGTYGIKTL